VDCGFCADLLCTEKMPEAGGGKFKKNYRFFGSLTFLKDHGHFVTPGDIGKQVNECVLVVFHFLCAFVRK